MKNYGKIFKLLMWVLVLVSVAILAWGSTVGFEANDGQGVDVLFYWAYAMVGLALFSVIVIGLVISAKNDPKSLLKLLIVALAVCAVVAGAYFLAPGTPALGLLEEHPAMEYKLTDTVLNLTYLLAGGAILSIVLGEIVIAVRNRK